VVGPIVYALCAVTATACAWLLLRAHGRSGARLLFWGGLCFAGLAVNNALVFVDLVLVPQVDLTLARNAAALVAMAVLVYGLVWDAE
jgi:hypothetical protein